MNVGTTQETPKSDGTLDYFKLVTPRREGKSEERDWFDGDKRKGNLGVFDTYEVQVVIEKRI